MAFNCNQVSSNAVPEEEMVFCVISLVFAMSPSRALPRDPRLFPARAAVHIPRIRDGGEQPVGDVEAAALQVALEFEPGPFGRKRFGVPNACTP